MKGLKLRYRLFQHTPVTFVTYFLQGRLSRKPDSLINLCIVVGRIAADVLHKIKIHCLSAFDILFLQIVPVIYLAQFIKDLTCEASLFPDLPRCRLLRSLSLGYNPLGQAPGLSVPDRDKDYLETV